MNDDECPGKHRCHGCRSWCPNCGDVDLLCDDPDCEAHMRTEEVRNELKYYFNEYERAAEEVNRLHRVVEEWREKLDHHELHLVEMVPRGSHNELAKEIVEG